MFGGWVQFLVACDRARSLSLRRRAGHVRADQWCVARALSLLAEGPASRGPGRFFLDTRARAHTSLLSPPPNPPQILLNHPSPSQNPTADRDVFPYLLVNIGSGVSVVKVDAQGHSRVSGSAIGGGTFWGLCRLLTGLRDFDEMLRLSASGNNANVDMLVGDIYGGRDYPAIGLSASTIACSFGKVVGGEGGLKDYAPADVAMALCRMVAYNIAQLAYLNAR